MFVEESELMGGVLVRASKRAAVSPLQFDDVCALREKADAARGFDLSTINGEKE